MKNCAEKKQTNIIKTVNFPKCSIDFELRGANRKEFESFTKKEDNIKNNPRLLELDTLAKRARETEDYSTFTEDMTNEYADLTKKASKKIDELKVEMLITCLTENKVSTAGYTVNGEVEFKDLNEVLDFLTPAQIDELCDIAFELTTLGDSEVAAEEVKQS